MSNFVSIFNQSFERTVGKDNATPFFDRFYAIFQAHGEVKRKFDSVPPERRSPMVRESLVELMTYYATGQASDYMHKIARMHDKQHTDIRPKLYAMWLEALLQCVSEFDPDFNEEVDAAWRIVVTPGIAFMTHHWPGEEDS